MSRSVHDPYDDEGGTDVPCSAKLLTVVLELSIVLLGLPTSIAGSPLWSLSSPGWQFGHHQYSFQEELVSYITRTPLRRRWVYLFVDEDCEMS